MPDTFNTVELANSILQSPYSSAQSKYSARAYLNDQITAEEFLSGYVYNAGISAATSLYADDIALLHENVSNLGQASLDISAALETTKQDLVSYINEVNARLSGQAVELGQAGSGDGGFLAGLGLGGLGVGALILLFLVFRK